MNKFNVTIIALALSAATFPVAAIAQTAPVPAFATVDSDNSGEVSYSELQIAMHDVSHSQFDTADSDNSGGLNKTEFLTISAGGTGSLTESAPMNDGSSNDGASN